MKTLKTCCLLLILCSVTSSHAQFWKKLGNTAEKAVERTVNKRVEKETQKKTDQALDTIFEGGKGRKSKQNKTRGQEKSDTEGRIAINDPHEKRDVSVNANFDFEAGNIILFDDDFKKDLPGDFPAKWDTNGSGEIITIDGEKWFRFANNSIYIPMGIKTLPENYTVEFDLFAQGLDNQTSSQAFLKVLLSDDSSYKHGANWSMVEISPCQFIESPGAIEKHVNGNRQLRNSISKDYRQAILGKSRISIAVNKSRMRVWVNDNKIVDVPRLVPEGITHFKLQTVGLRDARDKDELFISNFKIAESGKDNRSKLLTEGKISTNAILFETASATISGGGEDILKEVAEAMQSVPGMKILILGHTDADGSTAANLKLSQDRAEAVKMALVTQYDIKFSRIQTKGKGETEPIADNSSDVGKQKNRRVEFIKI